MASLKDIATRHKVDLVIQENKRPIISVESTEEQKFEGRMRRSWIEEIPKKETGFKQGLNPVVRESINKVETPFKHGFIRGDRPNLKIGLEQGLNRVKDLRGNPLKVMLSLINNISPDSLEVTERLSVADIAKTANISKESVKTALKFLTKNEIITRLYSQTGLHGWTQYKIKKIFIDDAAKQGLNRVGTEGISSSSNLNTTTNNTEIVEHQSMILETVDIAPLKGIGFTNHHLRQVLSQNKLSIEVIQDSINAYAFDLENNQKANSINKTTPLNYFLQTLLKGNPYNPPANYETAEDKAMRLFIERKKELEKVRLEREEELLKLACGEWLESLSEEEKQDLMSEDAKKSSVQGFKIASLRSYFKENLWSKKRTEFLAGG